MPRSAKRSGRVMLKFDVSAAGQPDNITVVGYTDKRFVKPSLKSLEQWRYDVSEDLAPEDRKCLASTITFRLSNEFGNILPEDPIQMVGDTPI
ncbi:MAG: energy transducer TonB [Litorimonas sp.]